MKIAHVNMFFWPTFGGVEEVMYELALRQVQKGHEVHVFCCDSDKENRIKKRYEIKDKIHIHRSPYWLRLSLSTHIWPGLIKELPKYDFDIVHSHVSGHWYILASGIISRIKGFKHVHTTHCPWTDKFRRKLLQFLLIFNNLFFNRLAFSYTDKIIAITPWEIPILTKWVSKEKIQVIPNGMPQYMFRKVKNNKFKKKLKFKGKIILFFGRFNITKGADVLALAAKELIKERKDLNFLFVGPDEGIKQKVKDIVKGEKRIKVLDPIRGESRVEVYQSADVFLLPSYREGLPLTLFEAMASGLPIVASPVNGIPFEMKDPENGYFVKYGDVKGLKEKILKILDNPKIAKKMSQNNLKKAKQYTWDLINERYVNEYKKLIK